MPLHPMRTRRSALAGRPSDTNFYLLSSNLFNSTRLLAESAEKSWRRLAGHNQLPKVILGEKFFDGVEAVRLQAQAAAA
jgi:hypothetical protein